MAHHGKLEIGEAVRTITPFWRFQKEFFAPWLALAVLFLVAQGLIEDLLV